MKKRDQDYYLARIVAERSAAEGSGHEAARAAHLRLAKEYQQILDGMPRREPPDRQD